MRSHGIATYDELIQRSARDDDWFWDEVTKHLGIEWFEPYHTVKDTSRGIPWTQWYVGGKLNIVHNVLDRHALGEDSGNLALVWEGEDGDTRMLTFMELRRTDLEQLAGQRLPLMELARDQVELAALAQQRPAIDRLARKGDRLIALAENPGLRRLTADEHTLRLMVEQGPQLAELGRHSRELLALLE